MAQKITFKQVVYGDCKCSCGCGKVLGNSSAMNVQWFQVVADADDDEGMDWRIFTPECYSKLADLTADEIYATYPAAPWVE